MIILIPAVRLKNNGISAPGAPGTRWRFGAGNLGRPEVDYNPALTPVIFVWTQGRVAEGPGGRHGLPGDIVAVMTGLFLVAKMVVNILNPQSPACRRRLVQDRERVLS